MTEFNEFPLACLRGIARLADYIDEMGRPTDFVFRTHSKQHPREDGWYDLSINWEDDENVADITLEFQVEGEIKYVGGAVRLNREKLDIVIQGEVCRDVVTYERNPIEGNEYHGNILIEKEANEDRSQRKAIAGQLAITITDRLIQWNE